MTELVQRERKLLHRLDMALLKGRGIEAARKALQDFYRAIGM